MMEFAEPKPSIQIKHAEIFKFRGIEESIVDDLSLVNLFVGRNNSRKSTLLDAIYLACKEPVEPVLYQILKDRVGRAVGASEIFFRYDIDSEAMMLLTFNTGDQYSLYISIAKENRNGPGIPVQTGMLAFHIDEGNDSWYTTSYEQQYLNKVNHMAKQFSNDEIERYSKGAKFFYSTVGKNELTSQIDSLLGKIKNKPNIEKELNEIMTDIYGEFQYEFVPRPERPEERRIAITDGGYRIFSDFHGDGAQRALSILSTLKMSTDTAIFIEDIEMFQHPKALKRLVKHTIDIAKKNRLQLFITTHSYEAYVAIALEPFKDYFNNKEEGKELFRCYMLTNNDGIVDARVENIPEKFSDELHDN